MAQSRPLVYSKILRTVTRSKTQNLQQLKIYPQAKIQHWYKDFYFLLAMNIISRCHEETGTKIDENTAIFPSFFHTYEKNEANKNNRSLVSKLYKTFFRKIVDVYSTGINISYEVDGKLNTNLSSHGGKKAFMQCMSNMGNNPVATVFRAGLTMKKMHTMFDYVFGSTIMDIETGLNISGWINPSGPGPKNGGLSPIIDDALNSASDEEKAKEKKLIHLLCARLFFRSDLDVNLHFLLLASIFKHYQSMVCTCRDNLLLRENHSVIQIVNDALSSTGISKDLFMSWCDNTIVQFKLKNILAMDYNDIKDLPDGVTVDVRTFQHQQELMYTMINQASCEIISLKKIVLKQKFNEIELNQNWIYSSLQIN